MSMSSHPAENGPTLLDLWKAQAKIENSRARENWDKLNPEEAWEIIGDADIIREPEIKPDSEKKIARKQLDAQIKAWAEAGMSTKEICARTGLGNSTVLRVVGVRNPQEDKDARKQRDDQVKAWADAGINVKEIRARTGLGESSVYRILGNRRPGAPTENNSSEDTTGTTRDT